MRRLLVPLRRHTLNDHEEMARFIQIFLDYVPEYMELLKKAFDSNNLKAMEAELHKLKSTFRVMGLTKAEKLCRTLDRQLQTRTNTEELQFTHGLMTEEVAELIPAYEAELVKLQGKKAI